MRERISDDSSAPRLMYGLNQLHKAFFFFKKQKKLLNPIETPNQYMYFYKDKALAVKTFLLPQFSS